MFIEHYEPHTGKQTDRSCSTAFATTLTSQNLGTRKHFTTRLDTAVGASHRVGDPTLGIPRAQVLLPSGPAAPDATDFELKATLGSEVHGILSIRFSTRPSGP